MRVGVIVAARAPVPWLDEALRSVLSQEPAPDAVVVVDHASDPALEPRGGVRWVRLDAGGGGPAAARQAGLEALPSDCDWVALADADDVWEAGKLAAQVAAVEVYPAAAVCFGSAVAIDAAGRPTREVFPHLPAGPHRGQAWVESLYRRNELPASSALIRRRELEGVGGFAVGEPLPAGSDWDLWLRLAAAGAEFLSVPEARIRYRRHAGGLTGSVTRLAEAGLAVHERHAGLVNGALAREARAQDLELLGRGRIRERDYGAARRALEEAAELRPAGARERLIRFAAGIPGARALLGRRDPYR